MRANRKSVLLEKSAKTRASSIKLNRPNQYEYFAKEEKS